MGTDIHMHLEYRSRKKNGYEYGGILRGERNYNMFEIMALGEVGSDDEALYPVRGLPCDVTQATYREYILWGSDAHHVSWLTTIEFASCIVEAYRRMNSYEALVFYKQYEDLFRKIDLLLDRNAKKAKQNDDSLMSYKNILSIMLDYEKYDGLCRVVFWFDN